MKTRALDPDRVERFSRRLTNMLNGGALALMLSIGHRTGLFDTLALLPPADSAMIAREAGLNERYVREWLAAMVTGGIVEYDAERGRYALPAEHAALLTRDARPSNVAATAQWIPLLRSLASDPPSACGRGAARDQETRHDLALAARAAHDERVAGLVAGVDTRRQQLLSEGPSQGQQLQLYAETSNRLRGAYSGNFYRADWRVHVPAGKTVVADRKSTRLNSSH